MACHVALARLSQVGCLDIHVVLEAARSGATGKSMLDAGSGSSRDRGDYAESRGIASCGTDWRFRRALARHMHEFVGWWASAIRLVPDLCPLLSEHGCFATRIDPISGDKHGLQAFDTRWE